MEVHNGNADSKAARLAVGDAVILGGENRLLSANVCIFQFSEQFS